MKVGDWVRWTTPSVIKEGQIQHLEGPSMVVRWLGGGEQVFPSIESYLPPIASREHSLVVIPKPQGASGIQQDQRMGIMSVKRAAALLGTTRKQVRSWLRNGTLRGSQVNGHWVDVNAEDVHERLGVGPGGE